MGVSKQCSVRIDPPFNRPVHLHDYLGGLSAMNFLLGGRYEVHFGERQDSPSRVFLRIVLRANRRKLPARAYHASLLLRSQLLRRSLRGRGLSTPGTREGIMTTIQDTNRPVRAAVRSRQVCDHCGGPFGMVTHRWWGSKFCRRRCKDAYLREIRLDRDTVHRLCGLLGAISRSRSSLEQKRGCVAPV